MDRIIIHGRYIEGEGSFLSKAVKHLEEMGFREIFRGKGSYSEAPNAKLNRLIKRLKAIGIIPDDRQAGRIGIAVGAVDRYGTPEWALMFTEEM